MNSFDERKLIQRLANKSISEIGRYNLDRRLRMTMRQQKKL